MGRKAKDAIMKKIFLFIFLLPFALNAQYRALSRPDIIVKQGAWYDVRAYGAIGGDATTDRSYIQAAIDSCGLDGGGVVYFPPETFVIDTTLFITRNNITLKGWQGVTTIQFATGANDNRMVYIDSCSYITIDGIHFDNNAANQTAGYIRCIETADSVYNLHISNCTFDDNARTGDNGGYGVYLIYCFDSVFENNFVDGWNAADFLVTGYCTNISIRRCSFKNLYSSAITIAHGSKDMSIENNYFFNIGDTTHLGGHAVTSNTGQTADETIWPRDIVINCNIAKECFGDVIHIEQGFRFIISSNIVRGYFVQGDTIGDTGISCSAEQSVIIGNNVSGNGSPGITLFNNAKYAAGYNMAAIGNIVMDNGAYASAGLKAGIWLDDVRRCVIATNIVVDNTGSQDYGIVTSGYSTYNTITNNIVGFNDNSPQLWFSNADSVDTLDNVIMGNQLWANGASTPDSTFWMSPFYQEGDIDARSFGGHKIVFTFYQDNVAANQSAVQIETNGALGNAYRMPLGGSILAICVGSTENRSAGTLAVEPYINNSATGLIATISTNIDAASASQNKDVDKFSAEAALAVKITTSADWAPTTADIYVTVIVEM